MGGGPLLLGFVSDVTEAVGMILPGFGEGFHFVGHLICQVVLLGAIGIQVVEFPWIASCSHQFPIALYDGAVAIV